MATTPTHLEVLLYNFKLITEKLESNQALLKELGVFFQAQAKAQLDYSKKTDSGITTFVKKDLIGKTEKTLQDTLQAMDQVFKSVAKEYLENSNKIVTDIVKPLEEAVKKMEKDKKRLVTKGQKQLKEHADLLAAAEKAHQAYDKLCQELKAANELYLQATTNNKPEPERVKLMKKVEGVATKLEKAENNYRVAVVKANEGRRKLYETDLPETLRECEALIVLQLEEIKKFTNSFASLNLGITLVFEGGSTSLKSMTLGISINEDLKEFATFHENDERPIEDLGLNIDEAVKDIVSNLNLPKEDKKEESKDEPKVEVKEETKEEKKEEEEEQKETKEEKKEEKQEEEPNQEEPKETQEKKEEEEHKQEESSKEQEEKEQSNEEQKDDEESKHEEPHEEEHDE